jgi:hypothetical protein
MIEIGPLQGVGGNWDETSKLWARRDRPNRGPCCPENDSWDNLLPWWGVYVL